MNNIGKIKLLIVDVDGVLTDGTKVYDENHHVLTKRFMCKDFTAIKRFTAAGIKIILLSGDNFNKKMAAKRNIEFYCSRNSDLSLDKSRFVDIFFEKYKCNINEIAFIGDDYFDLSMFKKLELTFCTVDSPNIIKKAAKFILKNKGGEGVLVELYDLFEEFGYLKDASEEDVANLDKNEITSEEMK
jgi:3-deoxy-D-manno-octulosonate 8-phosphate phosphatase (KDO 8-P phosphatase)